MIGVLASWLLLSMLLAPVAGWVLRGISRDYPTPPELDGPPTRPLTDAELYVARRTLDHIAHVEAQADLADDRIFAVVEQWRRA